MKLKNYPLKSAMKLSFLIMLALALTGCAVLNQLWYGPPPPPPPPNASWNSAPGFSADAIPKIAILIEGLQINDMWGGARQDPFVSVIEGQFIQAAFAKGYRVSDRSDVDKVIQEIRFQQSGLTEADAAHLGRMLNVPAVLLVKISGTRVTAKPTGWIDNGITQYRYTATCDMTAQLVSVEKAEVLGLASYYATQPTDNQNNAGPAIVLAANQIAGALPARNLR